MKVIIFDLDGTLIDSAADIHLAASKVLAARGAAPITRDQARGFVGHGAGVFVQRMMAAVGLPTGQQPQILAEFLHYYESAVHLTTLYPGVLAALDQLAGDGWTMGLCTNKPLGPTRAVLAHFGLETRFAAIIGGDSLPQRKPAPEPLWACLAALGCKKALFVGDSEVDAEAAHAAGMKLALYTEGYRKTPVADLVPHASFADFAALPGIAAQWWKGQAD